MFRRLLVRSLQIAGVLCGLSLVTVATAVWLAYQQPDFYHELSNAELTTAEREQLATKQREFDQWVSRVSRRRPHVAGDLSERTYELELTEKEVNSLLASDRVGSVQNVRVRILEGVVRLAAEIRAGSHTVVASAELEPSINSTGGMQFGIVGSQLGKLPLPIGSILRSVARHADVSGRKVNFDLQSRPPLVTLKPLDAATRSLDIKSIRCEDGVLKTVFASVEAERFSHRNTRPRQ